ncbi:MAG TPA: hypothetical protein DEF79_12580 [Gammaproteobacteria bacterium]|nr:hypothetical protein [Gammaproteobacteria bacterium]
MASTPGTQIKRIHCVIEKLPLTAQEKSVSQLLVRPCSSAFTLLEQRFVYEKHGNMKLFKGSRMERDKPFSRDAAASDRFFLQPARVGELRIAIGI